MGTGDGNTLADAGQGRTIMKVPTLNGNSSLLGLTFDGTQMEGAVVRKALGSVVVKQTVLANLTLDPSTNDPELAGRELRNYLRSAGVSERRCVVGLPLSWAMTLQVKMPDLSEEDAASFLQVQAERGFPYAPEDLCLCTFRSEGAPGERYATLVAVPRNRVLAMESALRAAGLKPASFTFSIAAIPSREDREAGAILVVTEKRCELLMFSGGGLQVLRVLDMAHEAHEAEHRFDVETIAREIRITLGQLPEGLRQGVTRLTVYGRLDLIEPALKEFRSELSDLGLKLEFARELRMQAALGGLPGNSSNAAVLAAQRLMGVPVEFEFLPPKPKVWLQAASRFSSRKLMWSSAAAAVMAGGVAALFLWQSWTVSSLEAQWRTIEPRVKDLDLMQQQIRRFRPWYDESLRTLTILRKLTEAFPADGAVTAKSVEIKDVSQVSCTGTAKDNQAFLGMLDRLQAAREVSNLKVDQVRGKAPIQFTLNFRWADGAGPSE